MKQISCIMMKIVKDAVSGTVSDCSATTSLSLEQANKIFSISKAHDVTPLLAYSIEKNSCEIDEQVKLKFQKEQMLAVYRYEQQNYELIQILELFEKHNIDFIPLKGSVIRDFYPEKWLRTSCDIDVLIKEIDLERAIKVLIEELAYRNEGKSSHDVSLFSPSNVHVELHYDLLEDSFLSKADEPLKKAWDYTFSKQADSSHKLFSDEMFYYYHIAHMAKHYVNGGCGIRPFIDLWLMNQKIRYDINKLKMLLREGGLDKFAEQAENLSKVWFGEGSHSELTSQMEEYILKAGTYGDISNKVAVQQVKKGGKIKYLISRIWLPYDVIKFHYPSLQRHKWLLPLYQIRRWFKLVFKGGVKRSVTEIKQTSKVNEQTKKSTAEMLLKLGLE